MGAHGQRPLWSPCVKSRSQNWDPTSWKSHLKSFQVSVLETASVKIQAPKMRSQVLKTMSWKPAPGPIGLKPELRHGRTDGHCSQSLLATRTTCCPFGVRGRNFLPLHYIISRFRFCRAGPSCPSVADPSFVTNVFVNLYIRFGTDRLFKLCSVPAATIQFEGLLLANFSWV